MGTVTEVDDPDTEAGKIIDSNPGAGTSVSPDTKINVRVGTGKVTVPNVVGTSQSEAQSTIAGVNLKVQTSFKQTNDAPEGTVVSQSPRDGTLDIGGTVKITVAQKPAPTVTPTTAPRPRPRRPPRRRARPTAAHRRCPRAPEPAVFGCRSAGGDHPGDAGGVVHERAQARPSARRHPASRTAAASWRASGGHRG